MNLSLRVPRRARISRAAVCLALIAGGATIPLQKFAASALTSQEIGIRAYTSDPAVWTQLVESSTNLSYVVVSPNSGAGTTQLVDWTDRIGRAQAAGQKVLGFLDTSGGTRSIADISSEISNYVAFYGVDGILLDGIPTSATCAAAGDYLPSAAAAIRAAISSGIVAANTYGDPVNACVGSTVDLLLTFTGTTAAYASYTPPSWQASSPVKIWHHIINVPTAAIPATVSASTGKGAEVLTITEGAVGTVSSSAHWTAFLTDVKGSFTPQPLTPTLVCDQHLALPSYFNDAPGWTGLTALRTAANPDASLAVVNVNSGPGSGPNGVVAANVASAQAAGIKVIGYVSTKFIGGDGVTLPSGATVASEQARVQSEIDDHYAWFGVDGIFLDEGNDEAHEGAIQAAFAAYVHTKGAGQIALLNSGKNVAEKYVKSVADGGFGFDIIVNFEGSASTYQTWEPAFYTYSYPASRFWHIVYSTTSADLAAMIARSKSRQGGLVYFSDQAQDPAYAALPATTYLSALQVGVRTQPSACSSTPTTAPTTAATTATTGATSTTMPPAPAPAPASSTSAATATTTTTTTTTTSTTTTTTTAPAESFILAVPPIPALSTETAQNNPAPQASSATSGATNAAPTSATSGPNLATTGQTSTTTAPPAPNLESPIGTPAAPAARIITVIPNKPAAAKAPKRSAAKKASSRRTPSTIRVCTTRKVRLQNGRVIQRRTCRQVARPVARRTALRR